MLFTIIHFFGFVLGVGGAFVSDALFLNSLRDGKLNATEARVLTLVSRIIWFGLLLLIVSGIYLFSLHTDRYLNSSKFLTKMTAVLFILVNGIVFHVYHFPFLRRHADTPFSSIAGFSRRWTYLVVSGAISMVSWTTALILAILRPLPYPYWQVAGVYALLLASAIGIGLIFRKHLF